MKQTKWMQRLSKKDLPAFEYFLQLKRLKPSTIKGHLRQTKFLLPRLKHIDQFLTDLYYKEKKSSSYITNLIATLRRLGQFKNIPKLKKYPFIKRVNKHIRATMSDEEIEAFLALKPVGRQKTNPLFKERFNLYSMFFTIMAYTAMRPGEVAGLTINNCDFGRGVFLIEDTKTNTPRLVPIPPILKDKLTGYIKRLSNHLLFPKQHLPDQPINGRDWQYQFIERIKRLGFKRQNLVSYSLRHSFATRMIEADVNIFKVKNLMGHTNIRTTEIYYHTSTKALQETIKQDPLTLKKEGKIICPICHGKGYYIKPD